MKRALLGFSLLFSSALGCGTEEGDHSELPSSATADEDAGAAKPGKDAGKQTGKDTGKDAGKATTGGKAPPVGGDDYTCASKTITAQSNPPDILIVLDRSLSMLLGQRWDPSATAVKKLAKEYEPLVSFGLSMFPGTANVCAPGMLDVPLKVNNGDAIAQAIGATGPQGVTPTAGSLNNALEVLGDRNPTGDSTSIPAYVVLVTDGEPSCPDDRTGVLDPVQGSIEACTALSEANIKTYVIGYGIGGGNAVNVMNQMAQAGGTDKYFPVENQAELDAAFDAITKDVVRCEFELDEAPSNPDFVRITIDGQTVELNAADGWAIEGKKVTLVNGSCDLLKDGKKHLLGAKVECEPVRVQ